VSTVVCWQVETRKVPVEGAVQRNQTSFRIAVWPR
jgi:hypothetical protein